jgi:hypothetical protein
MYIIEGGGRERDGLHDYWQGGPGEEGRISLTRRRQWDGHDGHWRGPGEGRTTLVLAGRAR